MGEYTHDMRDHVLNLEISRDVAFKKIHSLDPNQVEMERANQA